MKKMIIIVWALLIFHPPLLFAEEPIDAVKKPIERGLLLLKDPRYQGPEKKMEQRENVWRIIKEIFDFQEVSKRALARNWRLFTPPQRQEFTDLFSELLGNTYLNRIQQGFANEEVVYIGQEKFKNNRAVVKTKIVGKNIEIPIDYRMQNRNGQWRVYDVYVEGISLIKNYRSQFNKILMKKKPQQLIEQLKKKVKMQRKPKPLAFLPSVRFYISVYMTRG
jgi:phospholipid transport system substrate-binding protein